MKTATVNVRRARTAASANAGKIMAANKRHFPCTEIFCLLVCLKLLHNNL
jgi:hypothetical protein